MIIDEQFRSCVAFLVLEGKDPVSKKLKRSPTGTAFFVGVDVEGAFTDGYLVTARHVVEGARPFRRLFVRINKQGPGFTDFPTSPDDWLVHQQTDVAVLPFDLPQATQALHEFVYLPLEMLAGDDYLRNTAHSVFEGDDVFFVGMFSGYSDTERSHPIVRFGNVSLTPREKVSISIYPDQKDKRFAVDAYLVEARSWGGQSGSPAFLSYVPGRRPGRELAWGTAKSVLLGVTHGHFDIRQEVKLPGTRGAKGKVDLNAGIAIVIPAQKVIDLLMDTELVARRAAILKQLRNAAPMPTPDSETR